MPRLAWCWLPLMLSLTLPSLAMAQTGTDPPPTSPDSPPVAEPWPSYVLTPGPRGEPMAYVMHPRRVDALLLAAGPELRICQESEAACRDESAALEVERDACERRASSALARRSGETLGVGAGWGERLAWGFAGAALGVVGGVALIVLVGG